MGQLDSTFTQSDLDLLYTTIDAYEKNGQYTLEMIKQFKDIQMPENLPSEFAEQFDAFKKSLSSQEKEATKSQLLRRERTTFIKAKILMQQQELAADMAFNPNAEETAKAKKS